MPIFAVYKTSTGEITQLRNSPAASIEVDTDESYVSVDDTVSDDLYRINLSTLSPELKPYAPIASAFTVQASTTLSINGIPDGTFVLSQGTGDNVEELGVFKIDDDTLDFEVDLADIYTLVFSAPIYLDTTTVITVTE